MLAAKDELFTRPSGGYTIARSVRFRNSASANFSKTYGTSPTSRTTITQSVWLKVGALTNGSNIFSIFGTFNNWESICLIAPTNINGWIGNTLRITGPGSAAEIRTNQVFRDPSAWYHLVIVYDTTNATASDRIILYVNGTRVTSFAASTYPPQNQQTTEWLVSGFESDIGITGSATAQTFSGYMTEINVIDGQALTASSFGETDSITGVWKAKKYSGTYGTNGFYLNFSDNSGATATTIGKDYSGNGNNWTPNNISVTAGTTYDSMVDSPTVGATSSNYAVMNPLYPSSIPVDGNLNVVGDSNSRTVAGTMSSSTGKWYAEGTFTSGYATNGWFFVWDTSTPYVAGNVPATTGQTGAYYRGTNGNITKSVTGTTTSIGTYSTWTNNDIIGMAFDADAGTISFYKNNTLQVTITDSSFIGRPLTFGLYYYAGNASMNFGQRPFSYTPPTGYVALNTYNLPASTIVKGNTVMDATLYTGTLVSNAVTNTAGFKPDLVWIKSRSAATDNKLTDSLRGVTKAFISNLADGETTDTQGLTAFNSNGFTVGTNTTYNNLSATYVAWQWQAGQGSSASNTSGSITSTVSKNTTAGFSIVTYSGNSTSGATIGHGLGVTPDLIIVKRLNATLAQSPNAIVYVTPLGNTKGLILDGTYSAQTVAGFWNNTSPTSSVFSVGNDANTNATSFNYVAYCFSAVAGYSAFGSYTGNGSTDGPFIYTGFRPRFFMYKMTNTAGSWVILDSSRNPSNVTTQYLYPNASDAEASATFVDFVSNGIKFRTTYADTNGSGNTYIYAAFSENPFKNALAR